MSRVSRHPGAALVLMAGILSACQPANPPAAADSGTDAAAIRNEANAWFKAIADKDLDKTLSFYAPDARYLSAGRPPAVTPEARRKLWVEDFATPGFSSDEATTRIEVAHSQDLAYQEGTYASNEQDASGKAIRLTGKFVVVWKKQADGQWRAIIDIDNADQ